MVGDGVVLQAVQQRAQAQPPPAVPLCTHGCPRRTRRGTPTASPRATLAGRGGG
jgi:hypothetical protein